MNASVSGPLRVAIVVFGVLAAAAAGALALFTIGETYAVITAIIIAATSAIIAFTAPVILGRVVLVVLIATLGGSVVIGGYGAARILAALTAGNSGPVDPPDAEQLAAAQRKINQSSDSSSFQVTLTEAELNAVLLDALADTDTPFQRVSIDIVNTVGDPPLIDFVGAFKSGDLTVTGQVTAEVTGGRVDIELLHADVGMFTMPRVAMNAVQDMIGRVADLNRALADEGADIQQVIIGDDQVSVSGVTTSGSEIDASTMLAAFGDLSSLTTVSVDPVHYDPGIDAATAEGSPIYLALGDSLAAATGVDGYGEGYVSQVHRELSLRDGAVYGLQNLGIVGETSGTMISGGQLDQAVAAGQDNDVAYVTIDIGANDLLGHLGSADCSADITADACQSRIELSLDAYRRNIDAIFATLRDAFPDATIVFLEAYNPFSLGFEGQVEFETVSNDALRSLNEIAADAASRYTILVADGFTPMQDTAAATTHMTSVPPDIHPNELGYDILTKAVMSALG
jgi:lysophospholipase L1-like esterase